MNNLQVAGTPIRRDEEGRYCLNDLHRAAGGQRKHIPHKFLRNQQTKALINVLDHKISCAKLGAGNGLESKLFGRELPPEDSLSYHEFVVVKTVDRQTTYVVRELVYAYAMWVSSEFHLAVIEAYDALVNGEFIQPRIQHENYWFKRRPHWPPIRARVLAGECYRDIAAALQISRGRVARAVRSMIRVGLLAPLKVAEMQRGPARKAALRYGQGWGMQQLSLFDDLPLA